ncbi:hypothetical protein [Caballeronia calidae]|uniref:hypothetical protein n=1 Tax=Caballeronia calidae TaxID=1777139 RepID=UPI0012FE426E|nr:hypothetical protein [Caballeronia calidae]
MIQSDKLIGVQNACEALLPVESIGVVDDIKVKQISVSEQGMEKILPLWDKDLSYNTLHKEIRRFLSKDAANELVGCIANIAEIDFIPEN